MGPAMSHPPRVSPLASSQLADAQALLDRLLVAHKPGFALEREFHTDPGLYQLDLERIWRRGWLFVGHSCEVKWPGDSYSTKRDYNVISYVDWYLRQISGNGA